MTVELKHPSKAKRQATVTRQAALMYECLTCKVQSGQPCVGAKGVARWSLHRERYVAVREARARIEEALTMASDALRKPPKRVKPQPVKPGSLISRVTALSIGEIASHAVIIPLKEGLSDLVNSIQGERERVRNSVMSSVRMAAGKTGRSYSVEVTNVLLPSGLAITLAVIRCTREWTE